jgi:hypothetical protein
MHEPQGVLGLVCMAHQHAPGVLPPGERPCHLPATCVPTKGAAILSCRPCAVRPAGRASLDPDGREGPVEGSALVGVVADQPFGALGGEARRESVWDRGDFRWRSRRRVDGESRASAVCHRHELRPLAPLGLSHSWPPFCYDQGAVDEAVAEVECPRRPQVFGQRFEAAPQRAVMYPAFETAVAGLIRRGARGQLLPVRAAAEHPEDAVEPLVRLTPRAVPPIGAAWWLRNQGLDDRPSFVRQFCASCRDLDHSTMTGYL